MATASRRPHPLRIAALLALALHPTIGAQEPRDVREPLPTVSPASVGLDEERLARLDARMKRFVDDGQHAGVVMLLARQGRLVDWRAWGQRDVARQLPMEKDTIVRIYSMSKLITSVAVLTLHEEGRIKLDDPVAKYLPALKAVKVFKGGTAAAPVLAPARTPITIKHLLTHTSGFIYGFGNEPLDKIYNSSKIFDATTRKPAAGTTSDTGNGSGIQSGRFVESTPMFSSYAEKGRGFAAGGSGMFSTIGDYARFAQMLLNGGELEGVRILGRKTVELMTANHLNHLPHVTHASSDADGFGLGVEVRLDVAKSNELGSVGQFGWNGGATTTVLIDPRERLVGLVFAQHWPYNEHDLFWTFKTLVYQALVE